MTVLDVSNNRVTQVKSLETDGYAAIQVAYGTRRASRVAQPQTGHYAKAGTEAGSILKEFRLDPARAAEFAAGAVIAVESVFEAGQQVDVTGTTIGKGFAGTIKRHNFGSQRASHGNSRSHRVPGSIGQAQDPGRIFPGKRMAGHLGDVTRTVRTWTSFALTPSAACCWSRAPSPATLAPISSCARPSRPRPRRERK